MSTNDSNYTPTFHPGSAVDVRGMLGVLRRDWWLPALGCLIGLAVGVFYFVITPTLYKSSVRILLDRSVSRYLQTKQIVDAPAFDDPEIASQVYVLSSDSVIVPVVRSMNLAYDSEFIGPPGSGDSYINRAKKFIKQSIGWNTVVDSDSVRERAAVEAVLKRLMIYREDVANVVNVNFESEDSSKASEIANAIADTYVATTLESKLRSTKIVGDWLRDRLMELRVQATDADEALQNYKRAHNLIATGSGSLTSDQLSALTLQLTNSKVALAEAKARLDRIQQMADSDIGAATVASVDLLTNRTSSRAGTIIAALNNSEVVKLRDRYRELASKASQIESIVGPNHLAVTKLQERLNELRKLILEEEKRMSDVYAQEYDIAKARESELAVTFARTMKKANAGSEAQVSMRELESSAETLRNLYNSFLQKFKEINTIQTETIPVQSARIVSRAVPQLQKSSRKRWAVLGGSIMLGLFLGIGSAVGREWFADVFRTPKAVEGATALRSVVLPMITAKRERVAWFRKAKEKPKEEFVVDAPFSRFAETLRNVKAWIDAAPASNGAKVIGVISSLSKEGKTTVAANLSALLISSSQARTLLIDADLHLRHLTASLAPDAREGLIEALDDPSKLGSLVSKRQRSGVNILPCVLPIRIPNAAELLGSTKMERLLLVAREHYDYIIIEIPPIMSVVDIKMIERFIDGFLFVIEWGHTKRSVVQEALAEAEMISERVLGVILNKVDPVALRTIEAYKSNGYGDYYQE